MRRADTRSSALRLAMGVVLAVIAVAGVASAWEPLPVVDDPLLRMPGTQPGQATLEGQNRCANCHQDPDFGGAGVSIVSDFAGSMMAHSLRDPIFWATVTVAAQDAIWAVGTPNATDLCLRCHTPAGWVGGRSDPTNGVLLAGDDYDGVSCDSCHRLVDPFFADAYAGLRDTGGWDEATSLSATEAARTYEADALEAQKLKLYDGSPMFGADDRPVQSGWTENGAGQLVYDSVDDKRASFADSAARHSWLYSRYHKSRQFCGACHDVSNAVLQNLGWSGDGPLPAERDAAFAYGHVERTFSEFMLSDFAVGAGAPGSGFYDPVSFDTSRPGNLIAACQDCHMADHTAHGANKSDVPLRPDESDEHVLSGQPRHDLTGGNVLMPTLLASSVMGSPNYDAFNGMLLNQGAGVLTMQPGAGQGLDPDALLSGAQRALDQLRRAASIEQARYDA
ncbi:MAG: multiheme c-type cytochrome, partial [Myxococcales bacterium]